MRSANKKRLDEIESMLPSHEGDAWRAEAFRRLMPAIRGDVEYVRLRRRAMLDGTPPEVARRFEAEAQTRLIAIARDCGEHRLADWLQSSHDTN